MTLALFLLSPFLFLSKSLHIWSLDIRLSSMCQTRTRCWSYKWIRSLCSQGAQSLTGSTDGISLKCDRCHGKGNPCPSIEQWLDDEAAKIQRWNTLSKLSQMADDRVGTKEIIEEYKPGFLPPPPFWGCPEPNNQMEYSLVLSHPVAYSSYSSFFQERTIPTSVTFIFITKARCLLYL